MKFAITPFYLNPIWATLLISGVMLLASFPLWLSDRMSKYSQEFFLIGTGAMFSLCFFDLGPELYESGGRQSLYWMGGVALIYSLVHAFHLHHHPPGPCEHEEDHEKPSEHAMAFGLFIGAMVVHCFTSGILLVASDELSQGLATTVVLALLIHKAFEAFNVASVLMGRHAEGEGRRSRNFYRGIYAAYILSLPAGVIVALGFKGGLGPSLALIASSIAAGTLAGCLIFDFLLPAVGHFRRQPACLVWLLLGAAVTQAVFVRLNL